MAESGENGIQQDLDTIRGQARRLQQDMEEIRRDLDALAAVRGTVNDLFETIHLLDRVSDGIQQSVMDTRMLPIGPLFQRFKRVIRDISRSNGKNIRLDINGEKTELDKRMIDELGDPLIHMVRNSADHGIESPEVRLAAGKPEQGTVSLDAFHRGNSIYIRVCDDGKGLDSERIKAKALERGLISQVEAERMTKQQIFQLIWEPGLSTAEKVTEVSGRGMGMDIVKSKIELLNGTVELDSEMGKGTTVTIKLPLTLAILPSLMVSIDGDIFAMPLESVVEIINVSPKDISTIHRQPTARVRGRVVSMVELCEVFSWHQGGARSQNENAADNPASTLVIINENGSELGLAVDHVIGEQDIVIKSMAENYRNVQGVAGASILGDGRVSLILDLVALIDMATSQKVKV
jgi:two-component system chemotaxis sensor kinase CheA